MSVATRFSWRVRILVATIAIALVSLFSVAIYRAGERAAGLEGAALTRENQWLRERVREFDHELSRLRDNKGSGDSALLIERAAHQQMAVQIKALEDQNAVLKQELAFFEGVMSGGQQARVGGVSIPRMRVEPDVVAGQYRYRVLVALGATATPQVFKGSLQLLLRIQQVGKDVMINLPDRGEADVPRFRIETKHYQRFDGVFTVPPGATLKSVEARVLQDGALRARQSVSF